MTHERAEFDRARDAEALISPLSVSQDGRLCDFEIECGAFDTHAEGGSSANLSFPAREVRASICKPDF